MIKKRISNFLAFIVVILCILSYELFQFEPGKNLALFITWFVFVLLLLLIIIISSESDVKNTLYESYRNGDHLPKWLDILFYIIIIMGLAYFAWFVSATIWSIIAIFDLGFREQACKNLK